MALVMKISCDRAQGQQTKSEWKRWGTDLLRLVQDLAVCAHDKRLPLRRGKAPEPLADAVGRLNVVALGVVAQRHLALGRAALGLGKLLLLALSGVRRDADHGGTEILEVGRRRSERSNLTSG